MRQHRQRSEKRRQHDQQQRNAVDPDVKVRAERLDPGKLLDKLHFFGILHIEPEPQRQRDQESGEDHQVGPPADQSLILLVYDQENEHPGQRPEGNDAQDMLSEKIH